MVQVRAQPGRQMSTDSRALAGTNWRLVSFGAAGTEENIVPGTKPTLNFGEDGRASGSTGCNSFSGTYTVRGDNVSFGRMISTKRACLDQKANQQEQMYLSALEQARSFRLTSNRLAIYYVNRRNVLNFVSDSPETPDGPQPIENDPVAALTSYYDAINDRNYEQAFRYWETPTTNFDRFVRGFADTRSSRLLIEPPVRIEGAAGSLYAQIPAIVVAEARGGERFFAGCYTMRRLNQPGGAWRIYRATVAQVSAANALRQPISANCVR
ncbi:MAG TPA: META domain-containing protein [Pyrinomonadaceae bacterium]|nr:META domain-containing protein [Pyrinomonadaceae bacterium]